MDEPELLDHRGNATCLDFVNTVHGAGAAGSGEGLDSYEDLVRWAWSAGLLSSTQRAGLARAAGADPERARRALELAHELRELIRRIFSALAVRTAPLVDDVAALNGWLAVVLGGRRIVFAGGAYRWAWEEGEEALDRPLWPVVVDAAELLIHADPTRIRSCAARRGCGRLFLDSSRNGRRRWCSMRTCGNRAKARRHASRHTERRAARLGAAGQRRERVKAKSGPSPPLRAR